MAIYVVIGARGGTGQEIVRRLTELSNSDVLEIRAVVRDSSKIEEGSMPADDRLSLISGDCTQPDSLSDALAGASGVFFAASGTGYDQVQAVDQQGVQIVAEKAKELGVGRIVLVSSQLTHPKNKFHPIRGILNTIATGLFHKRGFMDFKFEGEQALRHSGQDYCIVRPAQLLDVHRGQTESLGRAELSVGQCNGSFMRGAGITRADLAAVCAAAMISPAARNCTFEVGSGSALSSDKPDLNKPDNAVFANLDPQWDSNWQERLVDQRWTTAASNTNAERPSCRFQCAESSAQ